MQNILLLVYLLSVSVWIPVDNHVLVIVVTVIQSDSSLSEIVINGMLLLCVSAYVSCVGVAASRW